ncbi:MAG: UDP-N-acetylmuramate dehydrogenase [Candidatus Dasytiphilus stammeri]
MKKVVYPSPQQRLISFNTFGIDVNAVKVMVIKTISQLLKAWKLSQQENLPILILGAGSNVLFLDDFIGTVIINRLKGIKIRETMEYWHLHVHSGENWHTLVEYTIKNKIFGLENLAFIPGCVGSAVIQNIGAYGIELSTFCEYVEILDLFNQNIFCISADKCQFQYRNSIFLHNYKNNYIITAVGLVIKKNWQPHLIHPNLLFLDSSLTTPKKIFDTIYSLRSTKLPNPKIIGNAGSFFKNPIIKAKQAVQLLCNFPKLPNSVQSNGLVKISAGWLIEQCNLKGCRYGGAVVHNQHALILINEKHATGWDIARLANLVQHSVGKKFNIWLEPEVQFIGAHGKLTANEVIGDNFT